MKLCKKLGGIIVRKWYGMISLFKWHINLSGIFKAKTILVEVHLPKFTYTTLETIKNAARISDALLYIAMI